MVPIALDQNVGLANATVNETAVMDGQNCFFNHPTLLLSQTFYILQRRVNNTSCNYETTRCRVSGSFEP